MERPRRTRRILLCGGIALLLYLTGLGRPALWEPDEGRYAEVAREMVISGDYVTPRDDWVRYFEKPPLVYWVTAGALDVFGRNEFAVRIQAAVFSAGQVAVTEALGEVMFGATAAMLGALALALSPLFFAFARFATPDPALAFFVTAALAAFYAGARTPDLLGGRGRRWMPLAAAMLALGTLAKGPVALVLGGAIAAIWLIVESRARDWIRIPWLGCAAVYLAITLPWFVLVSARNPGFLHFFLVHEHLHRFLQDTEHGWGPWFFVPVVVAGTWPWLYFVPFGISALWRNDDGVHTSERSALRFLLIWFGVIFIFFSIPRAKLGEYILPALAPVGMAAGYGLTRLIQSSAEYRRRWLGGFAMANFALAVAVAIAAFVTTRRGLSPVLALDAVIAAIGIFVGAALAFALTRSARTPIAAPAAVALGMVLALAIGIKARGDAAALVSYRELARTIDPYTRAGCVLGSYRHFVQALPFYTETREKLVEYRGELAPFSESPDAAESFIPTEAKLRTLWQSQQCVVLVANRNDLSSLARILEPRPSIIGCEGKKLALANRVVTRPENTVASQCGALEDGPPGAR